ncbi:MAG: hypothetical protein RBG13Loki_2635 [Promethearchaeota archaeon CR_4]|nr:MAG: hypothetical protein RBG13Loki_2635 [Candidatus Lokiarchaeota archaeon CR_4]
MGGSSNHIFYKVRVTRRVNYCEIFVRGFKFAKCQVDGNTTLAFFSQAIHEEREFERFVLEFRGGRFHLAGLAVRDCPGRNEYVTHKGRFTMINVPDDD